MTTVTEPNDPSMWLECEDCGTKSDDVMDTNCPYEEEINGKMVPAKLCMKCVKAREMDI